MEITKSHGSAIINVFMLRDFAIIAISTNIMLITEMRYLNKNKREIKLEEKLS